MSEQKTTKKAHDRDLLSILSLSDKYVVYTVHKLQYKMYVTWHFIYNSCIQIAMLTAHMYVYGSIKIAAAENMISDR